MNEPASDIPAPAASVKTPAPRVWAFICLFFLAGTGIGLTDVPYAYLTVQGWLLPSDIAITALVSGYMLQVSRIARVPSFGGAWLVPASLAAVLILQFLSVAWWPNSGDEYGYRFLADTLLHGRFYNPPAPVPDIFGFNWIFTVAGKRFSQYPPGFSLLLVPFLAIGMPGLLNMLLTGTLAWLFTSTLRALEVPRTAAAAVATMLVLSPFVLFNGAALYPHMLTAVAVLGIVRLQLAWDAAQCARYKGGAGALFSVLLLTRYEVFAIVAMLYGASLVPHLRRGTIRVFASREILPMLAGALPLGVFFLAYNTVITGKPFRTPFTWASRGGAYGLYVKGDQGLNTPWVAFLRNVHWSGELMAYTSAALVLLWALALLAKARALSLRYFDLIFPFTLAFFLLFASAGGHRFGPRYWLFGWPPAILTIATGLLDDGFWLSCCRWRIHLPTLAALHVALYIGFAACVAQYNSRYVALRRQVYETMPPRTPALILIPSRKLTLSHFQTAPTWAGSADFGRNDLDVTNRILYGRADEAGQKQSLFIARACSLRGRFVYVWRAPGVLDPITCAPARF
jgi:hypothetical protein